MDAIDPSDEDAEEQKRILDRELKDKVREQLKMPLRPKGKAPKSLAAHAKQNNINPNYDLPFPEDKMMMVVMKMTKYKHFFCKKI